MIGDSDQSNISCWQQHSNQIPPNFRVNTDVCNNKHLYLYTEESMGSLIHARHIFLRSFSLSQQFIE